MRENKASNEGQSLPVQSRFLLYQTEDGRTRIEVRLQDETVWMTQAAMAELYQITPQNITTHLRAIYRDGEMEESATCKEYLQVQREGSRKVSRTRKFYNLPEIIPYYEVIHDVEPGKHVVIVRVDRGWAVHHVWHANHRTYFIRVGSQSREASPEELERLFQQRGAFRLETRSVSGATLK